MNHRVIALSTMWGIGRYEHMAPFVQKVHEMGFTHVEVNYQVTEAMLEELKACPGLAVSSVHSPCPGRELADGRWTYRLRMTSEEEDEWRPALQAALDTVDTARALGAPVVVLHVGSVPLDQGLEPRLREMYNNGQAHTPGFVELRDLLLAQREARKGPYLQTAFERVRRVADYASDRGIKVGLESRYYFHEIPNLEEMLSFMTDSDFEERIPGLLPENTAVYHKIGNQVGVIHDAGIVSDGTVLYYVGILTSNLRDEEGAKELEAKLSKIIYDFMRGG